MTTYAKPYIILLSAVTLLLTGCTRLSNLESHGGSSVKETGIELKSIKLTTGKGKHSTKPNDTVTDTTPVDTSVDTNVPDTNVDTTPPTNTDTNVDAPVNDGVTPPDEGYDALTDGLYGPHT